MTTASGVRFGGAWTMIGAVGLAGLVTVMACGGQPEPPPQDPESSRTPQNTSGAARIPGGPGAMVTSTAAAAAAPAPAPMLTPTATATSTATATAASAPSASTATTSASIGGPCDKCVGTVTNDLQAALTKRAQDSRSCYVKVLTNSPQARASLNVEVVVGRDGSSCNANVRSDDPKWPGLDDCVLAEFKKGGYAPPGGAACVTARVPILFTPAQ